QLHALTIDCERMTRRRFLWLMSAGALGLAACGQAATPAGSGSSSPSAAASAASAQAPSAAPAGSGPPGPSAAASSVSAQAAPISASAKPSAPTQTVAVFNV